MKNESNNDNSTIERFEADLYQEEKAEFMSDKCPHCMSYAHEDECTNEFCEGKLELQPYDDNGFIVWI